MCAPVCEALLVQHESFAYAALGALAHGEGFCPVGGSPWWARRAVIESHECMPSAWLLSVDYDSVLHEFCS